VSEPTDKPDRPSEPRKASAVATPDVLGTPPAHTAQEDEYLAIRCQLGEAAAFEELIARWQGPLWAYVRRLVGEEDGAREVLQEAWLRILRGIARLRDAAKLRAWLFGIVRRTLMDRLRSEYSRAGEVELGALDPAAELVLNGTAGADGWDDRQADLQDLEAGLGRLPLLEREVLTLFYLRELSLSEVAETLGVPVGTVKSRLFRARNLLRREMSPRRPAP
jgi:RNA polymerase sigma-70 factor (ECF subfamily)